jgi:hypothetical protein
VRRSTCRRQKSFAAAGSELSRFTLWHTPTTPAIHGASFRPVWPSLTLCSPWVVLNDFGGAFSMGAVGGGIWYGIKGARNSPRVRLVALSSLFLPNPLFSGRTPHRRRLLHQSQSARDGWKLWRMGRHVLDFRLCNQGLAAEGGCLECYSFGVYDRWLFGCPKSVIRHSLCCSVLIHLSFRWPQICAWLCHCLRHSPRRLRRCRCPCITRIQRRQQTTNGTTYVSFYRPPSTRTHLVTVPAGMAPQQPAPV